MSKKSTEKLYTLSKACELLSISTATGRNWMKSGRLISVAEKDQKPLFEEAALLSLKNALANGSISGLKSRRNKTYVGGNTPVPEEPQLCCQLRSCAEQLILSAGYKDLSLFQPLLNNLIDETFFLTWKAFAPEYGTANYTYRSGEDTLGLLYQALCNIGNRKNSGSYYTPAWLAKQLMEKHLPMPRPNHTVLDPSCGTGIFLLQLSSELPLQNIYGNDINPVSVALTRINLALKYHIKTQEEVEILYKNISVSDFLTSHIGAYDIILGNPPWGARLSAEQKNAYRNEFTCASGSSVEIFDLFIEQSIKHLTHKGTLSFILPEAILTVKTHKPVREFLLHNAAVRSVDYLGEAFEQVHCPSIILTVAKENTRPFFKNVSIGLPDGIMFSTQVERIVYADSFSFFLTDEEYLLLQKILICPDHTTLVDSAIFALGIVTGNNKALLHSTSSPGLEPIIKGTDISKYHINSHSGYIAFCTERFQQTAPEALYRAPEKLFYRFINKQLIFAYDDTGLLSLNSCNILIPKIPGLSVKYVMAILNSSVAQFVFEKKFHSVKVLRSHLEQIPIPLADKKTQKEIIDLVDRLISHEESTPEYIKAYALLDQKIAELYNLTAGEYKQINSKTLLYN